MAERPAYCGRVVAIEYGPNRAATIWLDHVDPALTSDEVGRLGGHTLAFSEAGPLDAPERLEFRPGQFVAVKAGRDPWGRPYLSGLLPERAPADVRNGDHVYLWHGARAWELAHGKPPKPLGRIKAGSNVASRCFALEDAADAIHFEVGMRIALSPHRDAAFRRESVRVGEAVVCGVDRAEGLVTVQGNLSANICAAATHDFIYWPWEIENFLREPCPCEGKPLARGACGLCGRPALPPVAGIGTATTYVAGRNYGKTAASLRWIEQMRAEGRVDLDAVRGAPAELARLVVGRMAEGGAYQAPEPYWDLRLHVDEAALAIEALRDVADHDPCAANARANLRRYIQDCHNLLFAIAKAEPTRELAYRNDPFVRALPTDDSFFAVNRSADADAKFSPASVKPLVWYAEKQVNEIEAAIKGGAGVFIPNRERLNNELDRKFVEAAEDAARDSSRGLHLLDVGRWTLATVGAAPALLPPAAAETCGGCGKKVAPGEYCPCDGEADGCADCRGTGTRVSAARGPVPCECGEHVIADPYAEHAHAQIFKAREAAAQVHHFSMHAARLESIEQETECARRDLARLRDEAALRTVAADELERVLAEFGRPSKAGA